MSDFGSAIALIDEGLEIFTSLIDNVTRRGNYSPESTCTFIDQGAAAVRDARSVIETQAAELSRLSARVEELERAAGPVVAFLAQTGANAIPDDEVVTAFGTAQVTAADFRRLATAAKEG